ncbi:MAG: UrcA family protein [Halieaceae bacterium]|jgi:UrcA family protein|nr:UrcA family protein [Halieaceae bacterium]
MKHHSRHYLIKTAGGAFLTLALTMSGLSGAQQTDSRSMEETTVTSNRNGIELSRLDSRRAGVLTRTKAVSYADLNLDRQAGLDTLYSRLESASREVCSPQAAYHSRAMSNDWQTCYSRAMDKAIADVGNLGLQDYHVARTGEAAALTEQVTDRR